MKPFAAGTSFWDVEGVPVSAANGWTEVRAWGEPGGRSFPAYSVMRNGTRISAEAFMAAVARS